MNTRDHNCKSAKNTFDFLPDQGACGSDTATTAPLFFFFSSTAPFTNPYSSDILHASFIRSLQW